jgi:glycosyltransferase involved in cell wall biosynthesis
MSAKDSSECADVGNSTAEQQSVLIVNSYDKINERLKNEIRALSSQGYDVNIVLWQRGDLNQTQRTDEEIAKLDIEYIQMDAPYGSWKLLFYLPLFYIKLICKLFQSEEDVFHCCHMALLPATHLIGVLRGRDVVYDAFEYHALSSHESLPSIVQTIIRVQHIEAVENLLVRLADGVLTVDSANDQLVSRYRSHNSNTEVLYNSVSLRDVPDIESEPAVAERYLDRPLVTYTGGIQRTKGIIESLEAIARVRQNHPDVLFLFIGSFGDDSESEARRIVYERDLEEHVEFKKWMPYEEMREYLLATDVGLAPLHPIPKYIMLGRGCVRKQFTYMSATVPVVAPDYLESSYYIEDIPCGVTRDTTDPHKLARAITELLDDPERCEALGKQGYAAVVSDLNWENERSKVHTVYRCL